MNEQKSLIELAEDIMNTKDEPCNINALIDEVMAATGIDSDDLRAQLYIDITTSANFVYCGEEDLWDLKMRQSLDLWDKDGSYFNTGAEVDDEDLEGISTSLEDYSNDEEEEESSEEDEEESSWEDEEEDEDAPLHYDIDDEANGDEDDDEESAWSEDDEDKYNDMMDDYEDLYDDK